MQKEQDSPIPLYDFTWTLYNNRGVIYGGMHSVTNKTGSSDSYILDVSTSPLTWYSQYNTNSSNKWPKLTAHTAHYIGNDTILLLFGLFSVGSTPEDNKYIGSSTSHNFLALNSFKQNTGEILPFETTPPVGGWNAPRFMSGHRSFINKMKDKIWVWGGQSDNGPQRSLWLLDLHTHIWTQMPPAPPDLASIDSSMGLYDNWLVICFGKMKYNAPPSNNCSLFEISSRSWVTPTLISQAPPPRAFAKVSVITSTKKLYIFFGEDNSKNILLGDIWVLTLGKLPEMEWRRIPLSGDYVPPPRFGNSMLLVNDSFAFLWGGRVSSISDPIDSDIYVFDTRSETWVVPNQVFASNSVDPNQKSIWFLAAALGSIFVVALITIGSVYFSKRNREKRKEQLSDSQETIVECDVQQEMISITRAESSFDALYKKPTIERLLLSKITTLSNSLCISEELNSRRHEMSATILETQNQKYDISKTLMLQEPLPPLQDSTLESSSLSISNPDDSCM